jgi:hypothetical protein
MANNIGKDSTMALRTYRVTIVGETPLLQHADDIDWADQMDAWRLDKDHKKISKAGDDRSPAHRWLGSLYHNEAGVIILPTDNIMRALMQGGAEVPVPGGRSNRTFKAQTQSGIMPREIGWPLLIDERPIDYTKLIPLLNEPEFNKHREFVQTLGFTLFMKRARIGQSKHVRVRPRFDTWSAIGELVVTDDQITTDILAEIFEYSGKYKGLGDWRPSSKTPGTFGMFSAGIQLV